MEIKEYYFKRKILNYYNIYGNVIFSNNKNVRLYFLPSKQTIELVYNKVDDLLNEYEKAILIELILQEFCTFFKGIIHFSIGDYIEQYTLTDVMENNRFETNKSIFYEYFDSEYSSKSNYDLFKNLSKINAKIKSEKEKIGVDTIKIKLESNIKYFQRNDLIYFSKYFVLNIDKKIKFKFFNKNTLIIIPEN